MTHVNLQWAVPRLSSSRFERAAPAPLYASGSSAATLLSLLQYPQHPGRDGFLKKSERRRKGCCLELDLDDRLALALLLLGSDACLAVRVAATPAAEAPQTNQEEQKGETHEAAQRGGGRQRPQRVI